MKPVSRSGLKAQVEKKSILMLDSTRLYIRQMKSLVPANISSKQGNKKLPLEIWDQILELAAEGNRLNKFYLVQPRTLQENKDGSTTLICAAVSEWKRCGKIEDPGDVYDYQRFLAKPQSCEKGECDHPFTLPNDDATVFSIPIEALEEKLLFDRLTVPDVISRMERGWCGLCGAGRDFCVGCRDGREVAEMWTGLGYPGDCGTIMLCPLCIGCHFAEKSVYWQKELE